MLVKRTAICNASVRLGLSRARVYAFRQLHPQVGPGVLIRGSVSAPRACRSCQSWAALDVASLIVLYDT